MPLSVRNVVMQSAVSLPASVIVNKLFCGVGPVSQLQQLASRHYLAVMRAFVLHHGANELNLRLPCLMSKNARITRQGSLWWQHYEHASEENIDNIKRPSRTENIARGQGHTASAAPAMAKQLVIGHLQPITRPADSY